MDKSPKSVSESEFSDDGLDFDAEIFDGSLFGFMASNPLSGRLSRSLLYTAKMIRTRLSSPSRSQRNLLAWLHDRQTLMDKLSFVLGVTYIWVTTLLMTKFPSQMPLYFAITLVPLVGVRYVNYKKVKHHFFLADLCYFCNFSLIFFLFVWPSSKMLFVALFGLFNGPVVWAIYTWRNALVFHSLDKMTSIVIHLSGALTLYAVRWLLPPSTSPNPSLSFWSPTYPRFSYSSSVDTVIEPLEFFIVPLLFHLLWQCLYCYIILDLNKDHVHDGVHVTSFSWLVSDLLRKKNNTLLTRLLHSVGPENHLYFFIVSQFFYSIITIAPAYLFFQNFWIHSAFIIMLVMMSTFNGAEYYIEVFSRRYINELKKTQSSRKND